MRTIGTHFDVHSVLTISTPIVATRIGVVLGLANQQDICRWRHGTDFVR